MSTTTFEIIHNPSSLDRIYDLVIPDTNIFLSYPSFIPDLQAPALPRMDSLDLNHRHIVMLSLVKSELNHLKSGSTRVQCSARDCIRRLSNLYSVPYDFKTKDSFELCNNFHFHCKDAITQQSIDFLFSLWYVDPRITASPFFPECDDMDGKIIAAALRLSGTKWYQDHLSKFNCPRTTILSNDQDLRITANSLGVHALPYGFRGSNSYNGRRTVSAPRLLSKLVKDGEIPLALWQEQLPCEPPLHPNEFVVFRIPQVKPKSQAAASNRRNKRRKRPVKPTTVQRVTESPRSVAERFSFVGRFDCERNAIVRLEYVEQSTDEPDNVGQAIHLEAILNPRINVIVTDNIAHYCQNQSAIISYRSSETPLADDVYRRLGFV